MIHISFSAVFEPLSAVFRPFFAHVRSVLDHFQIVLHGFNAVLLFFSTPSSLRGRFSQSSPSSSSPTSSSAVFIGICIGSHCYMHDKHLCNGFGEGDWDIWEWKNRFCLKGLLKL